MLASIGGTPRCIKLRSRSRRLGVSRMSVSWRRTSWRQSRRSSHDESERKAIAAFDEEVLAPELPEALRLSAWGDPTGNHAGQVAAAMGTMAYQQWCSKRLILHTCMAASIATPSGGIVAFC